MPPKKKRRAKQKPIVKAAKRQAKNEFLNAPTPAQVKKDQMLGRLEALELEQRVLQLEQRIESLESARATPRSFLEASDPDLDLL